MAKFRRIHIRRFADIVFGSAINGAKTKVQKLALRKSIDMSQGQSVFNETIRNNSPTIYLVDPELVTKLAVQELINNTKYISSIFTSTGPLSIDNGEEFKSAYSSLGKTLVGLIPTIENEIRNSLKTSFGKVSLATLNSTVSDVYNKLISDIQIAESKGRKYISYQVAAAKAGAELRRVLNSLKISILQDASAVITNLGDRIPFVGYRFTATRTEINAVMQAAIDKHISNYIKTQNFNIGNIVHAGHVGIYSDAGLIGINMPAALIGGLVSNKFDQIEDAIGNLPIHIESGIKLSTNYTTTGGMLLDMQFNFAVSMPESLNSGILSTQEVKAINAIVGKITNEALEESIKKQLGEGSVIELLQEVGASPSFEEFLYSRIMATLTGQSISQLKHIVNVKLQNDITRGTTGSKNSTKNSIKVKAPTKVKVNISQSKAAIVTTNLVSLKNLINQNLAKQIQHNMGTGSSRRVLNYRSGRFANSATVERMTESRAGMITAFYSYMRNPYGTFAEGGAQESPASRNPKLLIAQSIRELAGAQVANRMRAVLV